MVDGVSCKRLTEVTTCTKYQELENIVHLWIPRAGDEDDTRVKLEYFGNELVGRHVIVVANLKPRKMRFGTSEGMVLAAGPGGEDIFLLSPDDGAEPGMRVK